MRLGLETAATTSSMIKVARSSHSSLALTPGFTVVALTGAVLAVCFPQSDLTTVNILFTFVYPLPSLYVLTFITTLRARESSLHPTPSAVFSTVCLDGASPKPSAVWVHREKTWLYREKSRGDDSPPPRHLAIPSRTQPPVSRNHSYHEGRGYHSNILGYEERCFEIRNASRATLDV